MPLFVLFVVLDGFSLHRGDRTSDDEVDDDVFFLDGFSLQIGDRKSDDERDEDVIFLD